MEINTSFCAVIPPVPANTPRPLWSIMIPTYNCANYLRETLTSVLSQDLGPEVMQIEVIDDCSTKDDPQAIVEEIGKGRVGFYRQPQNVGHTRNFEACLKRSRGHLVHLLHGDDCVREGFYQKMQKAFEIQPEIGAAFCRPMLIDENSHWQRILEIEQQKSGVLDSWLEKIATEQRILTPSIVVRRDVYEVLGGFDSRLSWSEDWEMWVRIAANYPIWYETEPLALYRRHSSSNTDLYEKTGENIRDLIRAINIIQSYLPENISKETFKKSKKLVALQSLGLANFMLSKHELISATNQIKEGLKCSYSFDTITSLIVMLTRVGLREIKSSFSSLKKAYN
ncbi:MAG: glycosyltransferase [Snowella sp.]|nr:glycosyltransferase [Snowella sp.]